MTTESDSARLRRLEDREEIRELLYSYGSFLDAHEFDAYADLFTEDGEWSNQNRHAHGRAEIREMVEDLTRCRRPLTGAHLLSSPIITFETDDVARSRILWAHVAADGGSDPSVALIGFYDDTITRGEDGRWRFSSRRASRHIPPAQPSR